MTPWFEPATFGALYGAIGGGGGGALLGVLAPLCLLSARRGRARPLVTATWILLIAAGVGQLGLGVAALTAEQPYAIWYPPLLCGVIMTVLAVVFARLARRLYEQSDARKLDAAAFRNT